LASQVAMYDAHGQKVQIGNSGQRSMTKTEIQVDKNNDTPLYRAWIECDNGLSIQEESQYE
jgi:hypothetical protein